MEDRSGSYFCIIKDRRKELKCQQLYEYMLNALNSQENGSKSDWESMQ